MKIIKYHQNCNKILKYQKNNQKILIQKQINILEQRDSSTLSDIKENNNNKISLFISDNSIQNYT